MTFNYTKTLLILIFTQCSVRALVGSEADKMVGVAILLFIFGIPIAIFVDWRSYRKILRQERFLTRKSRRPHTESEVEKLSA